MKKAVITLIVIAGVAGAGYYFYQKGYLSRESIGKLIPALSATEDTEGDGSGRVSSTDDNAVYVDSVSALAGLDSGSGVIERFAGVIEAQGTKDYKVESDRSVAKTYVKEGDMVKAGDKLFSYDVSSEQDKLEQAKIDLERAQNSMDISQQKKDQLEKELAAANTPAKKLQVLEEQNSIKQQELDIKSKQQKIETIQHQIDNSVVTCDIDGVVKSINASASGSDDGNDSVDYSGNSGSSAYVTILKTGEYRVKGQVNEQNISKIYQGETMLVHSRVDSSLTWTGTVTQIKMDQGNESSSSDSMYSSGDSSSGSTNYPFYVELESSDGLMLGQHVYLEEDLGQGTKKDGIWISEDYVVQDDGNPYVWAASSDNTLEKRAVTLGESDPDTLEVQITGGLSADDYIAYPLQGDLSEGLPVSYNDSTMSDQEILDSSYVYEETEDPNAYADYSGFTDYGAFDTEAVYDGSDITYGDVSADGSVMYGDASADGDVVYGDASADSDVIYGDASADGDVTYGDDSADPAVTGSDVSYADGTIDGSTVG